VALALPAEIHLAGARGTLCGRTRDLSVGGVCIATAARFASGDVRRVVLAAPSGRLELGAEGCWQAEAPGDEVFLTGVRFRDVAGEALEELWDLVHAQAKSLTIWLSGQKDFAGLSLNEVMELAHVTRHREFRAGRAIYRQDADVPGEDSIFVVRRGEVVLEMRTARERRLVRERCGPGCVLGGVGLVAGTAPAETAIAERDASLLEISRGAFGNLQLASPSLAFRLAAIVVRSYLRGVQGTLARLADER
jgi:hypothetical protein